MKIANLLRKNIRILKPYSSARLEYRGSANVYLDANENPYGSVHGQPLNRYPDPLQKDLKRKIAAYKKVKTDNIFIGNGSDEAIDLLIRAFCEPRLERIMICPPTYGVYSVSAAINNVNVLEIPLNDEFDLDINRVLSACDDSVNLIFLCSPNNPTGNLISRQSVFSLLKYFKGLVVIDEAYIDFANNHSWLESLTNFNNLVVLQTFSKAWGMANIRLGMTFGHSDLIRILNSIKYPYNVSGVSLKFGLEALDHFNEKDKMIHQILSQRRRLEKSLKNLTYVETIFPSDANFLLVRFSNSRQIYQHLLKAGIIVRDRSNALNCENCLRLTVGTEDENSELIKILNNLEI